jgi:hypothetical protein
MLDYLIFKNKNYMKNSSDIKVKSLTGYYNNPNVQAYGKWLGQYDWDYYCTFTTNYELTLKSARRLMFRFYDMNDFKRLGSTRLFWAAEPFDTKYGYHTHGLLKVPYGVPINFISDIYQVAAGNISKSKSNWHKVDLAPYDKKLGATYYCGKYITRFFADYDFWERGYSSI